MSNQRTGRVNHCWGSVMALAVQHQTPKCKVPNSDPAGVPYCVLKQDILTSRGSDPT